MRKRNLLGSLAAAAALWASALNADTLVIGQAVAPTGIDPHWHNHGQNNSNSSFVFDTLIYRDAKQQLAPGLATSWRPISDTVWEIELRKGVRWHDGTPFTAKDVAFTVERAPNVPNSPGPHTTYVKHIESVEIVDDHRIRIHTPAPAPLLDLDLAGLFIISEHVGSKAETADYTRGDAMIGTGPYKFVEWIPGDRLAYEVNPDYWGGAEPWDRVEVQIMKTGPARLAALLAGDVDLISDVPSTDIRQLDTDARVRLHKSSSNRYHMLVPALWQDKLPGDLFSKMDGSPMDSNPFKDVRVRLALGLAIDRNTLVNRVHQGQAQVADQLLPEGFFGYIPEYTAPSVGYDPGKAKQLLADAGYGDGFRMTLHTSNDRIVNAVKQVQVIAQMWTKIGLPTEVETMPHSVFSKRRGKLELPMYMSSWGNSHGEGTYVLAPLLMTYDKEKRQGRANRGRYSNAKVDRLTFDAMSEVDAAKREKLVQDALRIAMDDAAQIPLVWQVNVWATKPGLVYEARTDGRTLPMSTRKAAN